MKYDLFASKHSNVHILTPVCSQLLLILGAVSCTSSLPIGSSSEDESRELAPDGNQHEVGERDLADEEFLRPNKKKNNGVVDFEPILQLVRSFLEVASGGSVLHPPMGSQMSATSLPELNIFPDPNNLKKFLLSPYRVPDKGLLEDNDSERFGRDIVKDLLPGFFEHGEQSLEKLLEYFKDVILNPFPSKMEFKSAVPNNLLNGLMPHNGLTSFGGTSNNLIDGILGSLKLLSAMQELLEKFKLFL
ncbi:hypothetical protein PR048_016664 [Dryococelus australis]|uniref:Uncharacterized protein n=1 Tax=Dryococelus australis TaxID=614101 RepID=A0ABQ9H7F1_9NEOP|nr:hypothetical protein PR048_016664 [Dryococelus australis]